MEKEEVLRLITAVFSTAFSLGNIAGYNKATCQHWGDISNKPKSASQAWNEYVKFEIKEDNIYTPDFWYDLYFKCL